MIKVYINKLFKWFMRLKIRFLLSLILLFLISYSSKSTIASSYEPHGHLPVYYAQFNLYSGANTEGMTSNGTHLFITNFNYNNVSIFTLDGRFVKNFGNSGSGNGQLQHPLGIVYVNNFLYIADADNQRIEKFTTNGDYVSQFGSNGSGDGQFQHIQGITSDGSHLYAVDDSLMRIAVFNLNGTFINNFGNSIANDPNGFSYPLGITVLKGRVFVTDFAAYNIKVFDTSGKYLFTIDSVFPSKFPLAQLEDITSDSNYIYVDEYFAGQIYIFSSDGIYQSTYYGGLGLDYTTTEGRAMTVANSKLYVSDLNAICRIYVTLTPPEEVKVFPNEASQSLTVSWKGPQYEDQIPIKSYIVYRSTDNTNFEYYLKTFNNYLVDQSVNNQNTYYYKIAAVAENSSVGVSDFSSVGSGNLSSISTNGGFLSINFSFVIIGLVTSVILIRKSKIQFIR